MSARQDSEQSVDQMLAELDRLLADYKSGSSRNGAAAAAHSMRASQTPLEKAQALVYRAWRVRGKRRERLARKALTLSPDCADAYVILAEEAARSIEEAHEYYRRGVEAGERALGERMFIENVGRFWEIGPTRPYMRARAGLASVLWLMGARAAALTHFQEMLRLNPTDNQGIRYSLAFCLLAEGQDERLHKLLRDYDEPSAVWAYTWSLFLFRRYGDTRPAEARIHAAFRTNPHIPLYLLERRQLSDSQATPVGVGDESEAEAYVAQNLILWKETPGALAWLAAIWQRCHERKEAP